MSSRSTRLIGLSVSVMVPLLAGAARAQPATTPTTGPKPWTHLRWGDREATFRFVVLADRAGGMRPTVFQQAIERVNLLAPELVLCVGDLIDGYTEDADELKRQRDDLDAVVSRLEAPFFYVAGNHDLTNAFQRAEWQTRYGRPYYHFIYRDVLFLILNTEDGKQYRFGPEQLDYAERTLAEETRVRWTFVFMHKPMWEALKPQESGWTRLEKALAGRPHTIFAGHNHQYLLTERNGHQYYTLATTGGASTLEGAEAGQFDHVVWVTMTPDGPRVANLLLDGILSDDVLTQERLDLAKALGSPVSVGPLRTDKAAFVDGQTVLGLRNPRDRKLKLFVDVASTPELRAAPASLELELEPNSFTAVPLRVEAIGGTCPSETDALRLTWRTEIRLKSGKPGALKGAIAIGPAMDRPCPARTRPVLIDGTLNEWDALPWGVQQARWGWGPQETKGPGDLSFRFAAEHDANWLYVAVDVTDDQVTTLAPPARPQDQDAAMVYLEPAPKADGSPATLIHLMASPPLDGPAADDAATQPVGARNADRWPAGAQAAVARTARGYAAEFAIPVAVLDEAQGGPWKTVRLGIGVEDLDGKHKNHVKWQPKWDWPDRAVPGIGTFVRQ